MLFQFKSSQRINRQGFAYLTLAAILLISCSPQAEKVSSRTGVTTEKAKSTNTDTSMDFKISAPKTAKVGTSVLIEWDSVPGAISYDLILGKDKICEDAVFKLEFLDKTAQSVTLIQPGTYFICVTSRDSKGVITEAVNIGLPLTVLGEELQASTFAATSSLSATGFTLNWNAATTGDSSASGALEYYLCSGASAAAIDTVAECEAATSVMAYAANTLMFTISGKSPATTYYYNVVVKDAANNKSIYDGKSQATLADSDAPTAGSFAASTSVGSAGFTLNWGAATDNATTSANLQYFVCSGGSVAAIDTVAECEGSTSEMAYTANILTLSISGKSPATTYYYNVVVKDAANNKSIFDGKSQATSSDATAPTAGTFSSSTSVGATAFTLNWSAASDNITAASSLEYFVCSGASTAAIDTVAECEAATSEMAYTANITTLAISGKAPTTTYYYNVVVRDAASNKSLYNGRTQATTADTTAPTAGSSGTITVPAPSITASGFTLEWVAATDDVTAAASLQYFVCSGASTAAIDTVSECESATSEMAYTANTLSLVISGKSPVTTYYYNVVVRDAANNKAFYTARSQATASDTIAPTAGTFSVSTSVAATSFTLNWSAATDNITAAASLQYFVCSGASTAAIDTISECEGATSEMAYTANTLTRAISGKASSTTYYFNVVVRDTAGNKSLYNGITQATIQGVPVLSTVSDQIFPSNHVSAGSAITSIDVNETNQDPDGDTGMSYACVFDQVIDGGVSPGSNCTALPGTPAFNTSTGVFSWTTSSTAFGPYEFKITGTNGSGSGTRIFVINIRPGFTSANLRGYWDAQFANGSAPYITADSNWAELTTNNYDGTTNNTSDATWTGSGTAASPYSISLNGSANVGFGASPMSGQTQMMFDGWFNPSTASATNRVILGNSNNSAGNGFTLRQSAVNASKLEFAVGVGAANGYSSAVLADSPQLYLRLGESSGSTATDISGNSYHGTYVNSPTLGVASALRTDSNTAVTFNGSTTYAELSSSSLFNFERTDSFSIGLWIKATPPFDRVAIAKMGTGNNGYDIQVSSAGDIVFEIMNSWPGNHITVRTQGTMSDGQWHYVVVTYNGSSSASGAKIYADGISQTVTTESDTLTGSIINSDKLTIGSRLPGFLNFNGSIDEVAIYNTVLTPAQVLAHYQAATNICESTSTFTSNTWNHIAGSYQRASADTIKDAFLAYNPVGYWRLNETSGTTATDESGNGVHMTYTGSPTLGATGMIADTNNKAITLNGSSQYVSVVGSPALQMTNKMTWAAWIKPMGSSGQPIMEFGDTSGLSVNLWQYPFDKIHFSSGLVTGSVISAGNWYFIVVAADNSSQKIYVNGALSASQASGVSIAGDTLKPFNIGFRPYTGYGPGFFNGSIDEVALYNTTLTAAQIRELYDVTLNGRTALYANGRRECSFANPSTNQLSSPATNLTAGSTASGANFWTGLIADLRAYVTSNGAYPGGFVEARSNYDVTADRYRVNPLGNILRTNLALNLDAANARSNGVAPFANGCANLTWYSIMTAHVASLSGFTSCGSSKGWNGDGTTTISGSAGPYRLDFDGTQNWVETDFVPGRYSAYSYETWINTSNDDAVRAISTYRKNLDDVSMTMMINGWGSGGNFVLNLGKIYFMLDAGNIATGVATTTNFNDGAWHHVVGTWQGVNGQNITDSQFKIYVDGQLQSTTTVNGGWDTRQAPLNTSTTLRIGAHGAWGPMQYVGSMGKAAVYKSALSLEEVRQNCNALKSRYAGSNCN